MHCHYLQHVPFEGPAAIAAWAVDRGHTFTGTHLHEGDALPDLEAVDCLVVMGGPMGVHDEAEYPWLADEKAFIGDAIDAGLPVVGVCLGAQLVADVLGAPVTEHAYDEIGWFPVEATDAGRQHPLLADLPESFEAFHWHGDAFAIPAGATHLYESEACDTQAFLYDERVLGLQFHLEATRESVEALLDASDPGAGPYVQSSEAMLAPDRPFDARQAALYLLLDRLVAR